MSPASLRPAGNRRAFTLLELLIVIGIIGLLAAFGLPSLKGLGETNAIAAANRQLLDDLSEARLRAINGRATVYMLFVSPTLVTENWGTLTQDEKRQLTNILSGQYTSYALFTKRSLGDQPGSEYPRYLSEWRNLPDGVFIATNEFRRMQLSQWSSLVDNTNRPLAYASFPFPTATNVLKQLPYIAFDYQGQLLSKPNDSEIPYRKDEEILTLARGSVIVPQDDTGQYLLAVAEAIEAPRNNSVDTPNRIHIDWLTGRARVVLPLLLPP